MNDVLLLVKRLRQCGPQTIHPAYSEAYGHLQILLSPLVSHFTKLINHESFQHYFDTTVDYKHPNHLLFTRMTNILNHRQDDLKPPPPSLQVSTCL